jgi:hypothetical protein
MMEETRFYPKYMIRHSIDVLSLCLFVVLVLLFSFLEGVLSWVNIIGVGALLSFIIFMSRQYIRHIVFTSSYFLVERYVWPSKKIDYSDVIDMGAYMVKTRKGEISFAAMSNVTELQSLFFELMRQGKIDIEQFENKALKEEWVRRKSFWPAMVVSLALWGIFLMYWLYHPSDFTLIGLGLAAYILGEVISSVISSVIYRINKKKANLE